MIEREFFKRASGLCEPREIVDVRPDLATKKVGVEAIKTSSRGLDSFATFRTRVLFRLRGLDLAPRIS